MRLLPDSDVATVRIGPMRRHHVRQILRIERRVYPRPWSAAVFAGEIEQNGRGRSYIVARVGRRLVGYAGLMIAPDSAHITNIAVDPDRQGRGIGSRLLLTLARRAVDLGAPALTLEVRVSNAPAQHLYQRFGFVPAGVRKRYYEGTEDAIVMWAHDIGQPEYQARLDAIESEVRDTTAWEDG
jgi:[ribosomal protein S18]-alanine N-acetyltransferase